MKKNRKKQVKENSATTKKAPKVKSGFYRFLPFLLMTLALIVETCLIFNEKTGFIGKSIYVVFTGMLGASAYLLPIGVVVVAFFFDSIAENKSVVFKSIMLALFILFFSATHSIISTQNIGASPIKIKELFSNATNGSGGGVIGGLLGKLMGLAFGNVFSIIVSVIVCIFALSFFIGISKSGIWSYVKEFKMFGAEKSAIPKKKDLIKAEKTEISEPTQKNDSSVPKNSTPSVMSAKSSDPFAYGSSISGKGSAFSSPSTIDLRGDFYKEPETFDIYSEEPASTPVVTPSFTKQSSSGQVLASNGMAYSPFANPFKKEDFESQANKISTDNNDERNSTSETFDTLDLPRAYSPFANPLASMRQGARNMSANYEKADEKSPEKATEKASSITIKTIIPEAAQPESNKTAFGQSEFNQSEFNRPGFKQSEFNQPKSDKPQFSESGSRPESSFKATGIFEANSNHKQSLDVFENISAPSEQPFRASAEKTIGAKESFEFFDEKNEEFTGGFATTENKIKSFKDKFEFSDNKTDSFEDNLDSSEDNFESFEDNFENVKSGFSVSKESLSQSPNKIFSKNVSQNVSQGVSEKSPENTEGVFTVLRDHSKKFYPEYVFPTFDLLDTRSSETAITEEDIAEVEGKLLGKLASFRVDASLSGYSIGPTITRYEITPGPGVKVKAITSLVDDISLELQSDGVRISTVPGKSVIGIEVPNKKVSVVSLRSLIENSKFMTAKSKITVCVGLTVTGNPVYMDIDDMPHVLIAGQTKSGKSVAINCMLLSLLFRASPDEVQLILIDPKRVELNIYSKLPHLIMPVIDEPQRAAAALLWAVNEMERRYELMDKLGVRNRDEYYELKASDPSLEYLPQIIIVIDELADLMLQVREHVEGLINRLAAKARACGIHLLVGTQRPSVDIITGLIKANIPARISFKVSSSADSRIILGTIGAEKLLGKGDMLYQATGCGRVRVQGAFVSSSEIKKVTKFIIDNNGEAVFNPEIMRQLDSEVDKMNKNNKKIYSSDFDDENGVVDCSDVDFEYLCRAIEYIIETGRVATNNIQRHLRIGFNRAADIVDRLEELGFISEKNGSKPRNVLVNWEIYEQWKANNAM